MEYKLKGSLFFCKISQSIFGRIFYRIYSFTLNKLNRFLSLAKGSALFPYADNLLLDVCTDIKYPQNIRMGSNVIIGGGSQIGAMASIIIGDYVRLSRGVTIETATLDINGSLPYKHKAQPIIIERGVWLGANCTVLGGVTIGEGSVIGSGAIVTKSVPKNSIIVGARIRQLDKIKPEL